MHIGWAKRGMGIVSERRDGKRSSPGRKTRRVVGPGCAADEERAWRVKRRKGRLRDLNAETVVEQIFEDGRKNVRVLRLLMRLAGVFQERQAERRPPNEEQEEQRCFKFETAVAELRETVRNFEIDPMLEGITKRFQLFSKFGEYICAEAEVLQYLISKREGSLFSDAPLCLRFLERAMGEQDGALHNLVAECVSVLARCKWGETIWEWAGPRVRRVWTELS